MAQTLLLAFHWAALYVDAKGEWKMRLSVVPQREKEPGW